MTSGHTLRARIAMAKFFTLQAQAIAGFSSCGEAACYPEILFFLFLEIFIQNMQFIYTDICLNNLRYELHKLHFPNFSRLLRPPMARAQTTLYKKKKLFCIWILAISDPSRVLCMGSKFPFRETTLGRVWDSGLGYVRKPICKLL